MVLTHSLLSSLTSLLVPQAGPTLLSSPETALKALLAEDYSIGGHKTICTYGFQIQISL